MKKNKFVLFMAIISTLGTLCHAMEKSTKHTGAQPSKTAPAPRFLELEIASDDEQEQELDLNAPSESADEKDYETAAAQTVHRRLELTHEFDSAAKKRKVSPTTSLSPDRARSSAIDGFDSFINSLQTAVKKQDSNGRLSTKFAIPHTHMHERYAEIPPNSVEHAEPAPHAHVEPEAPTHQTEPGVSSPPSTHPSNYLGILVIMPESVAASKNLINTNSGNYCQCKFCDQIFNNRVDCLNHITTVELPIHSLKIARTAHHFCLRHYIHTIHIVPDVVMARGMPQTCDNAKPLLEPNGTRTIYQCDFCKALFNSQYKGYSHIRGRHFSVRQECPICHKNLVNLSRHISKVHQNQP